MNSINPANERLKRSYIRHMKEARGLADSTIDNALRALLEYERFTDFRDFGKFRINDAIAFKKSLKTARGRQSAERSRRSTIHNKLQPLQRFFTWLAEQPGHKTKIRFCDLEYLNLPRRDMQIARDQEVQPSPSLQLVQTAIRAMPSTTDLELRDRALMCCALLTGARVMALVTLKLRHVRSDRLGINQDAQDVHTKLSRSYPTFFFPVGDDIRQMFLDYVDHLRTNLGWNELDPLFPQAAQNVGEARHFHTVGLARKHWATARKVREIFKEAFARAEAPYYNPHSIRRTLALLGQQICRTPEELKAWSQNLGHNDMLTTFTYYGTISVTKVSEVMLSVRDSADDEAEAFEAFKLMRANPQLRAIFASK
jgi:site-specific recombinase XerD